MRCCDSESTSDRGNVLQLNEGGWSLVVVFVMVVAELWRCEEDGGAVVLQAKKVDEEFRCLTVVVGGVQC